MDTPKLVSLVSILTLKTLKKIARILGKEYPKENG